MTHPAGNLPLPNPLGFWTPAGSGRLRDDPVGFRAALGELRRTLVVVRTGHGYALAEGGTVCVASASDVLPLPASASDVFPVTVPPPSPDALPVVAILPPLSPRQLGDPGFLADHRLNYPYMTGAMANGIGSVEIVEAMGRAGMLGSFGAAGLSLERIEAAVDRLRASLPDGSFAVNLIHSPNEPAHEMATAELLLRKGVTRVEASAYLDLTPAIVRYRVAGFSEANGVVVPRNRVIAKVSRVEVATKFLSPPPPRLLGELVSAGAVTDRQAALAARFPMADDLTAEADSGGHTDNRPAITLLPTMLALRDRLRRQYGYARVPRVGLAGGIATPAAVAAAFAMGAAYVVTGSVNQACVEAGTSDVVRKMLAEAGQADVTMAPAADMFEMGVKLQVLKRGTMFPMRAAKLYELYRAYPSWEAIPAAERATIEKTYFRASFDDIWEQTRGFFLRRDPTQLSRAETDPKHRMALVFRWYLGLSSRWANAGEPGRQLDYQVWCGPAMGAFNEWVKGSPLEDPRNRTVVAVAHNLLYGACLVLRRSWLTQCGVHLPEDYFPTGPWPAEELTARLG